MTRIADAARHLSGVALAALVVWCGGRWWEAAGMVLAVAGVGRPAARAGV